jgi:hypothetical protein
MERRGRAPHRLLERGSMMDFVRRLTKACAAARSLRERLAAMDVRDLRSLIVNRGTRLRSYEARRGWLAFARVSRVAPDSLRRVGNAGTLSESARALPDRDALLHHLGR